MQSFNTFAYQLQNEDQQLVAQARNYAQSYTSLFGREVPPSYIDLGNFVLLMQANTSEGATKQAADGVHGVAAEGGAGGEARLQPERLDGTRHLLPEFHAL